MHNHVDHRWIKTVLRKIISVILVYSLFFTNTAHADNVGGWSMGNSVAQGASAVYTGTKNVIINGADYIKKGTAKITPPASSVAKVLARGGAGYALSVAVEQLLGSVDWVLDPANNRIKYTNPSDIFTYSGYGCSGKKSIVEACLAKAYNRTFKDVVCTITSTPYQHTYTCVGTRVSNNDRVVLIQDFNINATVDSEAEQKYLPLDVVAQQVISNAESESDAQKKAAAQVATMAAAADIVDEASKDDSKARPIAQQLESTAQTTPADQAAADTAGTGTGTQTKDPANPDVTNLTLEFPIFCNWAPSVCEAAQVVISFPQTLTDWWNTGKTKAEEWATSISEAWTAAKEWAKNDENEDTDNDPPEIQEIDIGALDTSTFKGVPGCPAPIQVPITFGTGGETQISYEPICQLADKWSFVAPLIGFLSGAMILVGVGRKGEDGEI